MRQPDPRIVAAIDRALGPAQTIVNVGAGAGSYEPWDRHVVAVEPSAAMISIRPPEAAPAIRARAEALPFPDGAFDAATAILTVHHWEDQAAGLAEFRRVARRQVVLTWDPTFADALWLAADYLPQIAIIDRRLFQPIDAVVDALGGGDVRIVEVPHDCTDGFMGAYWRRPEAYLDARARAAISTFARLDPTVVAEALRRLRQDLDSGAFWDRYRQLAGRASIDLGYRLIVRASTAGWHRCELSTLRRPPTREVGGSSPGAIGG